MPADSLSALLHRLQHRFSDPSLLQRAVTHRSYSSEHNERLEFLGDSVLNLAVSSLLFRRMQGLPEGELSRVRALLVKQDSLHRIAMRLQLPQVLRLGEGESKSGGKLRPSSWPTRWRPSSALSIWTRATTRPRPWCTAC